MKWKDLFEYKLIILNKISVIDKCTFSIEKPDNSSVLLGFSIVNLSVRYNKTGYNTLYTVICKPCHRRNTRLANAEYSYPLWLMLNKLHNCIEIYSFIFINKRTE